jgi:hypothetical protein
MVNSSNVTDNQPPVVVVHPYTIVSVKPHVPITLKIKNSKYSKWASYFKSLCGKFGLKPHIDGTLAADPADPNWDQADCCVKSWIFGSVDDSALDLAMGDDDQSACALWVAIENIFHANKEPRATFLNHEFHSMQQGDSSIASYCQRMKTTADALRDVGHPVKDSELVLNLLRGLNPRFSNTADIIANNTPLPTFVAAHDMLTLKELRLTNDDKVAASTALIATGCTSPGGCRSTSTPAQAGAPVAPAVSPRPLTGNPRATVAGAGQKARARVAVVGAVAASPRRQGRSAPLGPGFASALGHGCLTTGAGGARRRPASWGLDLRLTPPSLLFRSPSPLKRGIRQG